MSDSDRMPLDASPRRRLVRFDPTVNTGTLLLMAQVAVSCAIGYGAYSADQAKRDMRVEQVRTDLDTSRVFTKESLAELHADVKEIQQTLGKQNETLAVLKERSDPQQDIPRRRP
jgi:hypothetical protein